MLNQRPAIMRRIESERSAALERSKRSASWAWRPKLLTNIAPEIESVSSSCAGHARGLVVPGPHQPALHEADLDGGVDPQRDHQQRDEREPPLEDEHQPERDGQRDRVLQELGEGARDGLLHGVHVGRDAAQDLAGAGLRVEAHREPLQVVVQVQAQPVHDALADGLVGVTHRDAEQRRGHDDADEHREQPVDRAEVARARHGRVDDLLEHQRGQQVERRGRRDQPHEQGDVRTVRPEQADGAREDATLRTGGLLRTPAHHPRW